jgi:hypothetical protein
MTSSPTGRDSAAALGPPAGGAARPRRPGPRAGAGGPGRPRDPAAPDALSRVRCRRAGHRPGASAPASGRTAGRASDAHRVPVAHAHVRALRSRDAGPAPAGGPGRGLRAAADRDGRRVHRGLPPEQADHGRAPGRSLWRRPSGGECHGVRAGSERCGSHASGPGGAPRPAATRDPRRRDGLGPAAAARLAVGRGHDLGDGVPRSRPPRDRGSAGPAARDPGHSGHGSLECLPGLAPGAATALLGPSAPGVGGLHRARRRGLAGRPGPAGRNPRHLRAVAAMRLHRRRVEAWLRRGTRCRHAKTAATCREVLALAPALWTFVDVPGVEPTNNAAERPLRPAVLWRRKSFGTHSAAGSRFAARMLTVAATLKAQERNIVDYVTPACVAALQGHHAPSLLPAPGPSAPHAFRPETA